MATPFETYAFKGNEVLHQITEQLKVSRDKAFFIVRAVLHTTRNHIDVKASFQIIAHLPMALKGLYADQWDYQKEPRKVFNIDEFLDEVSSYDKELARYDLATRERTSKAVKAVYKGLKVYLPSYEFSEILAALPATISETIHERVNQPVFE